MFATVNFFGFAGSEMRAISAVDIALWDLLGQYTGKPIYSLLGGRVRDRILIYNTCVNYGDFQDYDAWNRDSGALAEELLRSGIRGMKIWPFDRFGVSLGGPIGQRAGVGAVGPVGHYLAPEQLREGLSMVERIRQTVGDRMEIAIEGHARWNLPIAMRIAEGLAPYDILWLEEIMPPDNISAYARLTASSPVKICASERLFTRFGFREIIERQATHIVMPDLVWTGGLTEARKIAALADTHYLPITTHDTIGPVALWASAHLALYAPNAMIVETVRGYYLGWYNEVMTQPLSIADGYLTLDERPGLGTALREEILQRADVHVEVTTQATRRDVSRG
jgi:L-alanine-DL-glutamate epimerase-like enolase superfamily enzyme